MKQFLGILSSILVLVLVGCGGGSMSTGSGSQKQQQPLDPQGNWLFAVSGSNGASLTWGQLLFELQPPTVTTNGNRTTAYYNDGNPQTGAMIVDGSASGTNAITLHVYTDAASSMGNSIDLTLAGTIATDQAHMSGTWTLNHNGNEQIGNSGAWTAQLLGPLTGTYVGALASGSSQISVTASLAENTDQTSSTMGQVSGTVTVSGACVASVTILNGIHIGQTTSLINTNSSSDPAAVWVNSNSVSVDGKTVNLPGSPVIVNGAYQPTGFVKCGGISYTGTLTKQ